MRPGTMERLLKFLRHPFLDLILVIAMCSTWLIILG